MKIFLRSNLSVLLFLISAAAFSQDTTKPAAPSAPVDTSRLSAPYNSKDTSTISSDTPVSSRKNDSIPVMAKDSSQSALKDSARSPAKDSSHRAARSVSAVAGAQGISGGRTRGSGRQSPAIGHFYGRIVVSVLKTFPFWATTG